MTPAETAELLGLCAAFDRRTIGRTDVAAWTTVLADIDLTAAKAAVTAHYATETRWIMPADIRQAVRQHRADTAADIQGPGLPAEIPDADPDNIPAYLAAIRNQRHRAADGLPTRRPIAELVSGVGRPVPPEVEDVKRPGPLGTVCAKCSAPVGRSCRTPSGAERAPHSARRGEAADPEAEAAEAARRQGAARDRLKRMTPAERAQLDAFQQQLAEEYAP
ncbi:hypothetical protein [Streptomyces cupreus]|uniref:DNA-binding phage zinc finger domain-containing protein n=1 Tax=Streptomyces cupreus TaxID=2759956 RepID=A0A7X1M9W1_9ACTN|nr:hypothetical protein [Streptomyces cupreus]MBC2903186.1 hypothetical protein [Streptomyces cupreus]